MAWSVRAPVKPAMMGPMILVTGPTGTVGSALLPLLVDAGVAVRVLAHSPASRERLEALGVEVVDGDLDQPTSIERAMEGCDRAFLLSPPHPDQVTREQAAIDAAGRAGVAHVVALSVMGASRSSPVAFARWHGEIDDHLMASGLSWTILRTSGFMQAHLLPVATVAAEGAWYGMTGDGTSAYVDIDDIASVAAAVLTTAGHEGRVYELTGPASLTLPEAARVLADVLGRPVRYVDVPAEQFQDNLIGAGLAGWLADAVVALYRTTRNGHAATVTNTVEQITGRLARSYRQVAEAHRSEFSAS